MGRPYETEIANLPATYRLAARVSIEPLRRAIQGSMAGPLVAIGSGGSLSAAHFAAALHQSCCGHIAKAMTPLESTAFAFAGRDVSALLLSAGGGNPDIVAAFKSVVVQEPAHVAVLTSKSGSKLARLVARYRYVEYCELPSPAGGDGFLATNSLLAFCVALARAYQADDASDTKLPLDFFKLVGGRACIRRWRAICRPLWDREYLSVLFPPNLHAAACDLESKFTEAAIGPTHIADYRHFAHGRHHWLAKKSERTGVIAFITPSIEHLAERTLRLLPQTVPVARLRFADDSAVSALRALCAAIIVAGFAGEARGIDPGRPGVPGFGRKIYHLRIKAKRVPKSVRLIRRFVTRKSNDVLRDPAFRWTVALTKFKKRLSETRFKSVVLDYDGTLCDVRDRFTGLGQDVTHHLRALLQSGIPLGIATGRGKSVQRDLRRVLPRTLWHWVVVGYYNGFNTALLSDKSAPNRGEPSPEMRALCEELRNHPFISNQCDLRNPPGTNFPDNQRTLPKGIREGSMW